MKEPLARPDTPGAGSCFVCGPDNPAGLHLEFFRLDEDTVTAELIPPDYWSGWGGLMHGGFLSLLLDEVTAWTAAALTGRHYFLTTGLEVKFRRPVRLGQKLTLTGRLTRHSARGARAVGRITGESGQVLAEAESRLVFLDRERFMDVVVQAP